MSAARLLYQLQEYRILLWKNNEGNLAFSVDKSIGFPQELKEQVKNYKTELLFLLEYNDICSEEQAKRCSFYKIPEQLNKQVLQTIQKGMYLQTTLDEQKATYTVPLFVLFKNANPSVLKQAIQHLVNRNPILRMCIVDGFSYEILPENSLTIHESNISAPQITTVCEQKGRKAFAVDDEPLIHLELMQISDTQDYLVNLTHHHMLSDAYSADLMINELVDQYQKISQGFVEKNERRVHYFDYTCFQDYALNTAPYQHAINQLVQQLDEAEPLNLLASSTDLADNRAGFHEFRLEKQTYKQVQQLALEHEISVYSLLLTGLYQVLSTYSGGQTNFPIALTVSNRLPEMNQVIGPFINTLPLIPEYKKEETVLYHAQKAHELISFLNTHHQLNLDVLAQHLQRSHEDLPALLQVMFTFHNFKQVLNPAVAECARPILLPDCYEKFGISIIAKECDDSIYFTVTYLAKRYDSEFIKYLFSSFTHLLTKYGEGAGLQKISSIHLLDEGLWNRIVHQLNHTEAYFPQQKTINQLFEEQVVRTPENLAVVYEHNRLTYQVLNNRANQLAHFLREHYALKPDTMVCLCLDRSEHMMISILAVLKAGAAYVPIVPDFPQARIEYLIQDTQTPLLLTNQCHQSWLASFLTVPMHAVDEMSFAQQLAKQSCDNLAPQHTSEHLAYVIYTSGTTGQPKGVMLEHRGVVNRIHWMNQQYPLSEQDKIIQKTPYVFDVSVWELLWAHWYGACLVFAKPEGHKDADYLYDLIRQEEITRAHFVPSMLNVFMDALELRLGNIPSLQMIFCSGEALKLAQVKQVHNLLPYTEIHNLYGPTEASIDVLYADCSDKNIAEIVIGKPIDNTTAYVLDEHMNPLPFYALGELYIGGVGLARGYLNRAELTKERFVVNPFQSAEQKTRDYNSRLYQTGDVVSLSPDGKITYHGRNDFQVKIRGHRIELGEIEQVLLACPQVKQSLVVVKKQSGQAYLVGYYVSEAAQDEEAMLEQLASRLPEYMVPTRLVHLVAFPLTANGKLDLKNLPEPSEGQRRDYELPSTELEQQLNVIWSEVLGIKEGGLSVHDDFFRLGGDSIISIQLISRIRQRLQLQVSVKDLFSCRTIRRLHEQLVARCEPGLAVMASSEQGILTGSVGLLPIQDWFFAHSFAKGWHWNQSFLIKTPALDVTRLRSCVEELVAHHDAFRLRFRECDGAIEQYYDAESTFSGLRVLDVSGLDAAALEEQMTLWQSGFNGARGPLYCFAYLSGYADGSSRIYIAMHHLLVDAVSWRILADDLHSLYEGQSLGAKGSSYRQWVGALEDYARHHEKERAYWQEVVADLNRSFLPTSRGLSAGSSDVAGFLDPADKPWDVGSGRTVSSAELELDEEFTSFLLREANGAYHTQINDLLLTTLAYALNDLSGESVHHVTLEGHGREDIAASIDVTRTVGWFTSLYPVRLELGDDLGHSIKKIKDNIRQIPNKGVGYGALLGYAIAQMPVVSFNYLGQFEQHSEFWHVVDESSGQAMHPENQDYHLINILGMIVDSRLKLRVDARLDEQKTQQLLHALQQHLHSILAYCQSRQDKPQYTSGDFKGILSEADLAALPLLPSAEQYAWFPMTEIQKAYLLGRLGEYEIGNVSNHVYSEYYYPSLDVSKLETIINYLIKEYPVLRTVYSYEQLQQRFLSLDETPHYSIKVNDYRHLAGDEKDLQLIRERLSHQVYDPQSFPLFAFEVTQFRTMWVLHVSSDLILLDVKSRLSFFGVISALYRNPEQQITSPSISFKDYQEYYQLLKHSVWYARDKAYWESRLPSMPLRLSFPFKQSPEQIEYPSFSAHTLLVDKEDWILFKQKASDYQVSYSSVLLSLYGSVLAYFSGHKEFLITLTLFNRYAIHDEANAIWGDFTTTDLFHFKDSGKCWIDTFERTHQRMWDDVNHALYTGMEVQRVLSKLHGLDATEAVSPIVFTGVVGNKSHHFDSETFLQADEFKEKRYWCGQTSQAWIDLQAVETGDCFMSKWLYVDQLFAEDFIATLNQIYCNLIKDLAHQDWNQAIDLSHYLPQKHQEIIATANQYTRAFSEETLVSAYERSLDVSGRSELIAVIDSGKKAEYSHGELWTASEQLAASILVTGTQGRLIAVLSEKGYSQVVATLSIMKAGYAYLPLHVDWPLGRVHEVLKQGGVGLVLLSRKMASQEETYASLANEYEVLIIEDVLERGADFSIARPAVHADDVAYVIFTSGSTGKPKGVTISHRGALNTIEAVNERFEVSSADKVLALSELSFDLSVYDIFGLLLAGGCIVFPEQEQTKEPKHWLSLIESHQISLWNTVPQLAGLLVDEAEKALPSLRVFLLSGDWIPVSLPKQLKKSCPDATVMSLGGATEGSIWSIWYPIEEVNSNWSSIPYGVAMPNQHMYVLNQDGAHCPVGVMGEIHIGGMGVALNYWGDEAITQRQFFTHPQLGKVYRTGDLGRWHEDGYMEFCGRNDFQVKIRGHRIELGEIEQVLLACPQVKQSLVVVKKQSGQAYLVGYYVSEAAQDEEAMLEQLASRLPEYMVPTRLVHLAAFPLTANGKLDLKNLPEPSEGQRRDYELPSTELEQQLNVIWSEVLGIKEGGLSVHDDFFRLGGDSIISIQLISRIRQRLQLQVSVKDLFSCRTIRRLHEQLVARCEPGLAVMASSEQGILTGSVGLLPIQDWFFAHSFAKGWHWNQSFLIKTPALDVTRLRSCVEELVAHHDAFRLRFRECDGAIEQYYDAESTFSGLRVLDVSGLDAAALEEQMTLWQSGFNGARGPLYCFAYLSGYADGSSRIYIAMHHLLVDAVSWRILADDLHSLYEGQSLGAKGSSYRQWVGALEDYARHHEKERAYWQEVVADLNRSFLPTSRGLSAGSSDVAGFLDPADKPWDVGSGRTVSSAELELDEEFTSFLLREANGAYHTQINDLLLTTLAYALNDLSGESVHHVTLEGHGREDIAASIDVTRTVGWFTSLYPVRLELGDDLGHSIKKIKDNIRQIPNKGVGYGALLGYAIAQMPVVSFNYLGQFEQQSEFWHVVDEPSGQAMHPENQEMHCITCFGGIHQGRLRMTFRTQLSQEVTDHLALVYKKQLLMILDHQHSLARSFLTLSDIHHCVSARCLDKVQHDRELDGVYLANSLHQGFMYHFMSQGQRDEAYRMQIVWSYDCELNIELLQRAWSFAQQRYPSLRLRFLVDEELVQVIDKTGHLHWQFIDLSQDKDNQEHKIQQLIQEDRQKAYDLTQGSLFRIQLIKQEATHYTCIFNAHHAIIDGWSGPLLLGFVHEMYMKLLHQECIDFTLDTAYAQSQHFLQVQELENQSFWQQYVAQIEHKADLSNLLQEGKKQLKLSDYKYITHQSEQTICIAQERFKQIKMMSQEQGITLNAIILYAWHQVMRIYGNGKQTVVGTIVSGRNIPVDRVEHSVGLYINTLPMIVDHTQHDSLSVLAAIRSVQDISNEINQRSAMSLAKLQSQGERLFDCLFMYGNYPNLAVENPEKQLSFKIQSTFEKRDYPLSLAADEEENLLRIKLTYAGELFDSSLMMQLLATLNYLLDQIARNPLQGVRELNYVESPLSALMSSPILSCTFIDCFEEQASLYPERIALIHEQTQISYAELNQRANQLAHYIRQQVVLEKDSLIGLCLEKNEYLMIALLAILKAGSAYLPIDPAMPAQRVQHILEDSQTKLVLTCDAVRHTFPQAVMLDDPAAAFAIAQQATSNLHVPLKPDDLAYVIYTSGTTGQPKGVMIEHGAFLQTLLSMQAEYFSEQKPLNTYSMTHFVFDIFGLEYGLPLLTGGKVELGNPLFNTLDCRFFDFIQMTPSVCELKLDSLQYCESITFLIGGEALAPELLAKALAKAHRVINVYGPTETTIWSTAKLYSKQDVPTVSIGKPLHHESVYVLDDYLMPMPVGAVGDLYIGGACLSRGYLNRSDLTAKQFMTHPLYNRLYKTGDLAKWLPNGELAFIGRNDFQVKIRGHRIELAEIEAVLRLHSQVKQTVVIELEQNLVAYFTATELMVEADLHAFLKEQLPDYMLPQSYMQLDQFPLTVNGKLDRKALPKPNLTRRTHYALPTTAQEKLLAALWEEVLGVSKVGVADNFFDLGGHSISLIKLFSKLPEAIKAQITVLDLFKFPSISALLGHLAADKHSEGMGQKKILPSFKQDDIAIIGMAGRFPGADDLETFWSNLQSGKEGITYYSREELLEQGLDPSVVDHPNYVKAQCKLSDIKCFDAEFFGYTSSEAEIMDPQHRLLMQCAWHALEDANYNPHHYAGDIGLFAGCGQNNYFSDHVLPNQTQHDLSRQFQLMIHQQANFLCTKIAYKLNLTGPAITIQTACSTSLVAVHQACLALNAGDCDIALAGGVSIGQLEKQGYLYQPGLIFSPDAKCRAFDAQAQGTFEGQGVGLVVLKPLSKALADEDFIYAVIKASAINNDGHQKIGFTAPSPQKQAEVIRLAQQRAACSPDTISYIEAHGTGTALGDPIEMEGLTQVFNDSGLASGACALGSVKTNIGHLDVAAGIAGLIKTILCLYHKQLVPTLHYQSANSKINFAASPFYVNTVLKPWTQGNYPRRAGISSFGIGGTNAHLILEEAPSEAKQERESPILYPFAKTEYWLPAGRTAAVAQLPTQANGVIVRDREHILSVLRSLWTTLLGIESFKNNEDFFDLGGDSLAAVQLSAQLQRQLGVHLELMSLNRITIDGLLALIEKEQEKTAKARSPVVLIKAGKTQQNTIPLVLIHPIGGDVYFYRDLAKALPENQTVYALRSPLLDGGTPFSSIESMAASYLHHLQQFGLQSPYILGGSSFGGAVAIEMAKQLAQSGQSIPLVALIDTPAYTNLPKLMSQEEILIYLMQHGLGNLQISVTELQAQKTLDQKIEFIANRAKDSELKELLSTEFLPRFLHTWQAHGQLLHQYQPEPYPGRVLFFAHTEVIDDFPAHQEQHWQKLVHGSFKPILVPGTHITMNAAPHVQVIADALVFDLKQRYYSRELLVEVEA